MMEIEKPKIIFKEENDGSYAKFVLEPLEQGFGITLGNCLRRVLLASLPGAAVSGIKIEGVMHEFTTIRGVKEDVTEIVLNIKNLIVKTSITDSNFEGRLRLRKIGAGEVYASDIEFNDQIQVVNKDLLICTLDDDAKLDMELFVTRGRGYKPASSQINEDSEIGYIAIDAIYSPVTKVNYNIENARVGQSIDFDKLTIEVFTDGSCTAKEVISLSAKVIQDHIGLFVELVDNMNDINILVSKEEDKSTRILEMTIDDMDLTVRSRNCLKRAGVNTIEDLLKYTKDEMCKIRNLGSKSAEEIESKVKSYGLNFRNSND